MDRPMKEDLDRWLDTYRPGDSDEVECDDCSCRATYGLAREVRALQEELKLEWAKNDAFHTQLARIEATPVTSHTHSPERNDAVAELVKAAAEIERTALSQSLSGSEWRMRVEDLRGALKPFACDACVLDSVPEAAAVDTSQESK